MNHSQELNPTIVRDIIALSEDGTLKDVVKLINDGKYEISNWYTDVRRKHGSIAQRTAQLVLVFPVLASTSLNISTSVLISKAIERKCVSLLQILFSAINLTDYSGTGDLYNIISRVHTNLDDNISNISLDDFINGVDDFALAHENAIIDQKVYDSIMSELKDINEAANDYLRESSLNDYKISKSMYNVVNVSLEPSNNTYINEADNNNYYTTKTFPRGTKNKANSNYANRLPKQLLQNDMTKANELMPTTMMVNFVSVKGGQAVEHAGVIGVKAKLYPVESMELIGRISSKYSDSNSLFNLIRCSTKEKSFFRDLAFAFDKMKLDAINIAKGSVNSKIFRTLERRAWKNKSRLLRTGDASPITTIVISQEEVEYLKKNCNMDVEKPNTAAVVLDGYNLMGFVIADDSIEAAKFLFDDGENRYETISYSALAKEDKNGDYKKIVNLMARMNR